MDRREEIIYAALELASECGLRAVSLSQIADRVGIKKPSLYNHFVSKDEIVEAMYVYLREQAKKCAVPIPTDKLYGMELAQILSVCMEGYVSFLSDADIQRFFKVLYSERTTSAAAAGILLEESARMTASVRELFYALAVHGIMKSDGIDSAALSYAYTIHTMVDSCMDRVTAGEEEKLRVTEEMKQYIAWFAGIMKGE